MVSIGSMTLSFSLRFSAGMSSSAPNEASSGQTAFMAESMSVR